MGTTPAPFAATTDAEGKFSIDKVEPGTYRLSAERQGFVRQEYGARLNSMMGTTINVATGQNLKDLNFKMTPQAVVRGRVLALTLETVSLDEVMRECRALMGHGCLSKPCFSP